MLGAGIAQTEKKSSPTKLSPASFDRYLSIGGGTSWSVINNRKETRGQYKMGFNGHAAWHTSPWFSVSADYTWFLPHHSSPAFNDIKSWNSELNGNLSMAIGQSDLLFKTMFGLSYMEWEGTYVGPSLNDNNKYYYGLLVEQSWVGANLGCGLSYSINRNLAATFDYRLRFASEKRDLFSISDTGFFLSLDWKFRGPENLETDQTGKKRKPAKNRHGRIYKWLKRGV